ncbi:ComEC/Rec2 family competence protein [Candidatus Gracilibacteria bacterium]|nr:ComEC/Rec2 family competence protein [Candidatus Gracilibacteria bacterium]
MYGYKYQQSVDERYNLIISYQDLYTEYRGVVYKVQKRAEYYDEYIMQLKYIGNTDIKNTQNIYHILRVPKNFVLLYGETYSYSGVLRIPQDFNNFSYTQFLQSRSIYFRTNITTLQKLEESPRGIFFMLFTLREHLVARSEILFPYRESLFLSGILFGAREHLPQDIRTQFNNSGLTHFITTSGFHVSLVILFLSSIFIVFPPYVRVVFVTFGVISFALFVGYGAPVIRASIMGILGYILLQGGSNTRNLILIVFTLTLMVGVSPLALLYDVSLQLSFLAVLGILFTQNFFKKIFSFLPNFLSLRDACVLTFSAFSGLFPVLFFQFGQISLLTPLANMLVAWTIPLAMLGGALILLIDAFSPSVASFLSFPLWILLRFDMLVVELIGTQDWALVKSNFGAYSTQLQILYLLLLGYILTYYYLKKIKSL